MRNKKAFIALIHKYRKAGTSWSSITGLITLAGLRTSTGGFFTVSQIRSAYLRGYNEEDWQLARDIEEAPDVATALDVLAKAEEKEEEVA